MDGPAARAGAIHDELPRGDPIEQVASSVAANIRTGKIELIILPVETAMPDQREYNASSGFALRPASSAARMRFVPGRYKA